ncbi:MAG: NADH-quinone oxidoreductase subunit N [Thermoflexibacter sp.]
MNPLNDKLTQIIGSLAFVLPEVWLVVVFCLLIVIDLFGKKSWLFYCLFVGLVIEIGLIYLSPLQNGLFLNTLTSDALTKIFKYLFASTTLAILLLLKNAKKDFAIFQCVGESYAILSVILLGMNLLVMSTHLLMLYLSLEIVSIGGYVLAILSFERKSVEISMKYVLFGIFASAIMLYGMSLLYGFSGSLHLAEIAKAIQQNNLSFPFLITFSLAIAGFLFKISASPFHIWTPDVYEGAPTTVVAFFSTASKAAGLAVLSKFVIILGQKEIYNILAIIALASMLIGNFSALWQFSFKRLLAYSGIAQAGFMLLGLLTVSEEGVKILIFYFIVYVLSNVLAFLGLILVENKLRSDSLLSFSGLGQNNLVLGISLGVSMISLVGLPPTAGFTAKFLIFSQLWQDKTNNLSLLLLIVGLLSTAISLYFYLKIPYYLFFKQDENKNTQISDFKITHLQKVFILVLAFSLLLFFFRPDWLLF